MSINEIVELKMELARSLREKGYYPPSIVDRLIEVLESNLDSKRLLSLSSVSPTDILPIKALIKKNPPGYYTPPTCSHDKLYGPGPQRTPYTDISVTEIDPSTQKVTSGFVVEKEIKKALRKNA